MFVKVKCYLTDEIIKNDKPMKDLFLRIALGLVNAAHNIFNPASIVFLTVIGLLFSVKAVIVFAVLFAFLGLQSMFDSENTLKFTTEVQRSYQEARQKAAA